MILNLYRTNYLLVGATSRKTLRLLPPSVESHTQKIAVADHDGVLHVFSVKKDGISLAFKVSLGSKITCLDLGGSEGSSKDRIFVAVDNKIQGYTKRGKLFFDISTNLTEPIRFMKVMDKHLFVCGRYICNHYENGTEVGYMIYEDEITDMAGMYLKKTRETISITALRDGTIHIARNDKAKQRVGLSSKTIVLHISPSSKHESSYLFLGTIDGKVGKMDIQRYLLSSSGSDMESVNDMLFDWLLENKGKSPNESIVCIDTYDLTGDEIPELIIGRQDGSIEVYSMVDEEISQIFSLNCNESITSILGGRVSNNETGEIITVTASGWIFGLTQLDLAKEENIPSESQHSGFSKEARQKILQLRSEIGELEQKVTTEREKYLVSTEDRKGGVSAIPFFNINHEMVMIKESASYILRVETQVALDSILLQSDVQLDLLDTDKNSAVVSYSKCEPESGNSLLASYRCQVNARRLQIELFPSEGQSGTLRVYVTPQLQPKCCRVIKYPIRPLSLHARCSTIDKARIYNVLSLKGSFSMAEIHSWVYSCLPDVPERQPTDQEVCYFFYSTFLGTQLWCKYRKGKAEFKSDNITTISILKDCITKEATKKNITLEISCDLKEASLREMFERLDPILSSCLSLRKQVELIEALREIMSHNQESSAADFDEEFRGLLEKEDGIRKEINNNPFRIKRIHGMITNLYVDSNKFKGVNVKSKVPQLKEILNDYSLEKLLNMFS